MSAPLLNIIHEDAELLVINKVAGLVCHPTKGDDYSSLVGRIRLYLGANSQSHLINRLDRETSGVVVAAKTRLSASLLGRLWERRQVEKEYLAIVRGIVTQDCGVVEAPLARDLESSVAIKDCVRMDGTPSQTKYHRLRSGAFERGEFSLLAVVPRTGRKHQIRIHLAHLGHPIVGDKLYGGDERIYLAFVTGELTEAHRSELILPFQALHAECVRFEWGGRAVEFRAPPEEWFLSFARQFSDFDLCAPRARLI